MEFTLVIFLSSGLFLGWALGANDAANVFGTAVGSRMVKFSTAAIVCSIFVILGATISGGGAAHTLGKLGAVNALGGAFVASLAAALTVFMMTKFQLPVSTGQAVVGAIIGWNIFAGAETDLTTMRNIMMTWVMCPVLSALVAVLLYQTVNALLKQLKLHILKLDWWTRVGLVLAGAFGSYSLGANNIANVMGVFVNAINFDDLAIGDITLSSGQQLFLLGALAIAIGVFSYSKRVMLTVGNSMMPLTPVTAWIVVMAHSIALFLFSSESLELVLASSGLPTIPLVPVSSSQAVVGAIVGIGLLKGGQQLDWRVLRKIASGWVTTPPIAMALAVLLLFVAQNLFAISVKKPLRYVIDAPVIEALADQDAATTLRASDLMRQPFDSAAALYDALERVLPGQRDVHREVVSLSLRHPVSVDTTQLDPIWLEELSPAKREAITQLQGQSFRYQWQFVRALEATSAEWQELEATVLNKAHNKKVRADIERMLSSLSL